VRAWYGRGSCGEWSAGANQHKTTHKRVSRGSVLPQRDKGKEKFGVLGCGGMHVSPRFVTFDQKKKRGKDPELKEGEGGS